MQHLSNLFLILLIIIYQLLVDAIEWDSGLDQSLYWIDPSNPQLMHQLQFSALNPRNEQVKVQFQTPFTSIPKVLITVEKLDWQAGLPFAFKCNVTEVTNEFTVFSDKQFYSIDVRWFAIIHPFIEISYHQLDTAKLASGKRKWQRVSKTKTDYVSDELFVEQIQVNFTNEYPKTPEAAVFMLGSSIEDGATETSVDIQKNKVTNQSVTVKLSVSEAHVNWIYIAIIVVPKDIGLRVSSIGENQKGDCSDDQNWGNCDINGERFKRFTITEIEEKYVDGFVIQGITKIQANADFNLRVLLRDPHFQENEEDNTIIDYAMELGTWGDSQISAIFAELLMLDLKDDCAFLFTQCDYQGQVLEICDSRHVSSFSDHQFFGGDIKSILVPEGRVLNLYEEENLQGRKLAINQSQSCFKDQISFHFFFIK